MATSVVGTFFCAPLIYFGCCTILLSTIKFYGGEKMIADLTKSQGELLEAVTELIDDPLFLSVIESKEIGSKVIDGRLYWNLGFSQGYAVIDLKAKKIYRVFETDSTKEALSDNSLCDRAIVQLVLEDIIYVVDSINQGIDELLVEEFLSSYGTNRPDSRLL
jgi:hypothetical protein